MSKFLQGSSLQCALWHLAFDQDAKLPIRGVTLGGPDRVHPTVPGPGWTTAICHPVIEVNPGLAVLEIQDDQLFRLGKTVGPTVLPPQSNAQNVTDLPPGLRNLVYARQGKDNDGNPLPFLVSTPAEKKGNEHA